MFLPPSELSGEEQPRMDVPGKATEGPVEALAAELEAARLLLHTQEELETAMLTGVAGAQMLECVRRQELAVREVKVATHARRLFFPVAGSLEAFIATQPTGEAERLRRFAREASQLRGQIQEMARRLEYVAHRAIAWTQAQVEIVVRAAGEPAVTYDAPGMPRRPRTAPSLLDRSA
jgi:hypothetical protein